MCKCTPEIRTPFCGKPGCEAPELQKFGPNDDPTRLPPDGSVRVDGFERFDAELPECKRIVDMREFNGHLYVATDRGVYRLVGDKFERLEFVTIPVDEKS